MADTQSVTLWQLAVWTYARQRAHMLLRKPGQCFEWAMAASNALDDGPRPTVAWDAAMLHGAVCEIAGGRSEAMDAIIWPAANLKRPHCPVIAPRCYPVEVDCPGRRYDGPVAASFKRRHGEVARKKAADDDEGRRKTIEYPPSKFHPAMERNGRGVFEGKRIELQIKTLGFEVGYRPVYEKRGRRWKQMDTEPFWTAREFCPLRWDPDPAWSEASIAAYATWRDAMMRLWQAMQETELRDHQLVFEEIPPPPESTALIHDSWAAGRSEFEEVEVKVGKVKGGEIGVRMFDDAPMLLKRRVRAEIVA